MIKLEVQSADAGQRLDRFLAQALPAFSRARLQALIREKFVTVNGEPARPRDPVRARAIVEVREPELEKIDAQPEEMHLDILFEDDDLLVLNKPAGLVVHPGAGHQQHTLVNALLAHCKNLSGIGGKERPGIVHRLDKDTSGVLVVAKNDATHRDLSRQFAERTTGKVYLALVAGTPREKTGAIDAPIARHPVHRQRMSIAKRAGRPAKTDYRVLESNGDVSLIECTIHTGRTHQIRVHLHHLGHPVLGDKVYGGKRAGPSPRQMLHAWKLSFVHPRTEKTMSFTAPIPDDFAETRGQIPGV
ncbi:MAG TPA: RluA family pseudouridine synthase [Chthoniobacterales bacterium]|jgi:23S rRNA pseudouridine1911/1915/1917 synthase|nr:RluA family pseudouridine synthase [Chthoniobacterales bacterium]